MAMRYVEESAPIVRATTLPRGVQRVGRASATTTPWFAGGLPAGTHATHADVTRRRRTATRGCLAVGCDDYVLCAESRTTHEADRATDGGNEVSAARYRLQTLNGVGDSHARAADHTTVGCHEPDAIGLRCHARGRERRRAQSAKQRRPVDDGRRC